MSERNMNTRNMSERSMNTRNMNERKYNVCMFAPLGRRDGTMTIHETDGEVNGWLDVMNHQNALSGQMSSDGQVTLSGTFQTLVNTVAYTATGTISGLNILLNLKTDSGIYYPVSGEEYNIDD